MRAAQHHEATQQGRSQAPAWFLGVLRPVSTAASTIGPYPLVLMSSSQWAHLLILFGRPLRLLLPIAHSKTVYLLHWGFYLITTASESFFSHHRKVPLFKHFLLLFLIFLKSSYQVSYFFMAFSYTLIFSWLPFPSPLPRFHPQIFIYSFRH